MARRNDEHRAKSRGGSVRSARPGIVAALVCASFLGPFGWVGLAAMLSAETPAEQGTTMVLAVSIYSLGAAAGGAAGGAALALGGYPALGLALPLAAAGAVVPVWRR